MCGQGKPRIVTAEEKRYLEALHRVLYWRERIYRDEQIDGASLETMHDELRTAERMLTENLASLVESIVERQLRDRDVPLAAGVNSPMPAPGRSP